MIPDLELPAFITARYQLPSTGVKAVDVLTLAGVIDVVVTAPLVTLDQDGARISVLVCSVIVAADLEVPVLKVLSK